MTPYELLLGNPPTDEDQIRAAAARLRGTDQRSVLAMLSGDRILAPIGQEQMRATQGTARGLAKARQALEERNARKSMFDQEWKMRQQLAEEDRVARSKEAAANRAFQYSQLAAQQENWKAQNETEAAWREAQAQALRDKYAEEERKLAAKDEKLINDETRRLSFKLVDEGITDLESSIDIADKEVSKYFDPNTGQRKVGDIPGYGGVDSTLPNALLGEDGKRLRNVLASVRNKILKARSGAAVTDPEMMRLAEELGTAMGQTEEEMIQAYVNVRKALDHVKGGVYAGFAPEVAEMYESRLGANARRVAPANASNPNVRQTRSGYTYEVSEE